MPSTTTKAQAATSNGATEKDPRYIAITVTPELLTAIRNGAKAAGDASLAGFCRTILAKHLNVTIEPATSARRIYATEEERKAAHKAAAKERQQLIAQLLKDHKAKLAAQAAEAAKS